MLKGMTPFDFRVIERHPQERGTGELGSFYSLSHLGAKRSSGQSLLPTPEAQRSTGRSPFPPIPPPFGHKKAAHKGGLETQYTR